MSQTLPSHLSRSCRACLSPDQEMYELSMDLAEQFQRCTEVMIPDASDCLQICCRCWKRCENWCAFRKKSQMSDQRIKKAKAKGTLSTTWDLTTTCRICLHEDDTVETFELSKDFREQFEKCTSVSVTDENQQICASCWGQCEDWWEFRKMSQINDHKVRKSINSDLQEMRIENLLDVKTEPNGNSSADPQENEDEPMEGILSVTVPGGAECKIEMLQCPICDQDCANVQDYEDHFKIHHRVTEENGITLPNSGLSQCLFPSSESAATVNPDTNKNIPGLPMSEMQQVLMQLDQIMALLKDFLHRQTEMERKLDFIYNKSRKLSGEKLQSSFPIRSAEDWDKVNNLLAAEGPNSVALDKLTDQLQLGTGTNALKMAKLGVLFTKEALSKANWNGVGAGKRSLRTDPLVLFLQGAWNLAGDEMMNIFQQRIRKNQNALHMKQLRIRKAKCKDTVDK